MLTCQGLPPGAWIFPRGMTFPKSQKGNKRVAVTLLTRILMTKFDRIFHHLQGLWGWNGNDLCCMQVSKFAGLKNIKKAICLKVPTHELDSNFTTMCYPQIVFYTSLPQCPSFSTSLYFPLWSYSLEYTNMTLMGVDRCNSLYLSICETNNERGEADGEMSVCLSLGV